MKVLIIPDVHLKPFMFKQAAELMERGIAKRAVCLMDIPDDWDKQFDISLYEETYDAAISFAKKYPDTAWCYGNHDLSYVWHKLETGYSPMAAYTVQKKLIDLKEVLPEGNLIKYVHRIDNVLFSHAGMSKDFVNLHVPKSKYDDVDDVLDYVNHLGEMKMWYDGSPIWLRPQYTDVKMYKSQQFLQVVGHTPMETITKKEKCDIMRCIFHISGWQTNRNRRIPFIRYYYMGL